MLRYPQLTAVQQQNLPPLTAQPVAIPNQFEDSTHYLWHCQTQQGDMVLKVCNSASIEKSNFWFGANHLFGADFPNSLGAIDLTHAYLSQYGMLQVPSFVASAANSFVLTRYVSGAKVNAQQLDDDWVIVLAKHIAQLHQNPQLKWGQLNKPQFANHDWPKRLHSTLKKLSSKQSKPIIEPLLNEALAQALTMQASDFVPMMLDLRWDQFLSLSDTKGVNALALIDLDAFVIAPKSLDLVLLAYLMSPAQFGLFKQHYQLISPWPKVTQPLTCYQLLLFLMEVLGEKNLTRWMSQPIDLS